MLLDRDAPGVSDDGVEGRALSPRGVSRGKRAQPLSLEPRRSQEPVPYV